MGWRKHKDHSPMRKEATSAWICSCGALLTDGEADKILQSKGK